MTYPSTRAAASPLTFDPEAHVYRIDGVVVPSVTQVLRQTGYIRLDGVSEATLEHARERGRRVHQALHFLFDDDLDEDSVDDELRGYLESARRYLSTEVRQVLRVECRVHSTRYMFAGTLDLLALHADGALSVDDFKTGHPDDVAADLQTGAYLGALFDMVQANPRAFADVTCGSALIRRRSIRLFADGRTAKETIYPDHRDYAVFLNALNVVHDQARRPQPMAWDLER